MTLTARQKILIPILVVVLVFLGWQVYRTATEGALIAEASQPNMDINTNDKVSAPTPIPLNDSAANDGVKLSAAQLEYVDLVNQFQRLQMEKMIAANSQAIAEAKLKTAEAEAQLATLSPAADTNVAVIPHKVSTSYQLVYTGKFQNQWTATLRKGSELIDINVGNRLDNGATVVGINGEQVILKKGNKEEIIGFDGQISKKVITPKLAKVTATQVAQIAAITSAQQNPIVATAATPIKSAPVVTTATPNPVVATAATPIKSAPVVTAATPTPVVATAATPIKSAPVVPAVTAPATNTVNEIPALAAAATVAIEKAHSQAIASTTVSSSDKIVTVPQVQAAITQNSKVNASSGEQNILALNPKQFSIQLIASFYRNSITKFITQNNLAANSIQFQTIRNGRPWYVLSYGQYNTVTDATQAIKQMPGSMTVFKPFVRQIGQIQKEIKAQHIG